MAAAYAELRAVDGLFSTWRADSEVSPLRRGERQLDACDPLVREVADLCEEAAGQRRTVRSAPGCPTPRAATRFDPTGLVKGWAADRAAAVLERAEGHAYCLNAGGDVVVGGRDAGDTGGRRRATAVAAGGSASRTRATGPASPRWSSCPGVPWRRPARPPAAST